MRISSTSSTGRISEARAWGFGPIPYYDRLAPTGPASLQRPLG